ncbi:HNH endonuclease [Oleiphilus sp. HI0130]|nr:HNH endonuclease [Oleiphilus sp. HI0130]
MNFYSVDPTLENYWRSIILFGRNVASYKFALSKSLIQLSNTQNDLITLEALSEPFALNVCEHLKLNDKQATSSSSRFLDECRKFNEGTINKSSLVEATKKLGFKNVIEAFHVVNSGDIPERFFIDERRTNQGIRLTDNFFKLIENGNSQDLFEETESRWRLVETAWSMNLARHLITVEHDIDQELLITHTNNRRTDITSSRAALNGYQKGKCFYSFKPISIESKTEELADVDHFFPHVLKEHGVIPSVDGVWNLVLATKDCNRGENGKFAKAPSLALLERLHKRNEYLISSHHPLRETLIKQTGNSEPIRRDFLQTCYNRALEVLIHTWEPQEQDDPTF